MNAVRIGGAVRAAAVAIALVAACTPKVPALPSAGGPRWIELTSAHFQFFTDGSEDLARRALKQMEDVRSVLYGVVFPEVPAGGRTIVLALRDWREARVFVPPMFDAFAVPPPSSPMREPLIVMPLDAYGGYGDSEPVKHELAHALSYNAIHNQPHWFAEGLADYFETITIRGEDVELGRPPEGITRTLARGMAQLWPIANIFGCRRYECMDDVFYERAWALFAYLRNTHPHELVSLAQGIDDPNREVTWREMLPDLPRDHLDHAVGDWLLHGNVSVWHYTLETRTWPVTVRTLDDSEVLALRALLWWIRDRKSDEVEGNLAAAFARNPNDLLASFLSFMLRHRVPDVERAHAVVSAHPKSWMAWALLAEALPEGPKAEVVKTTMCSLIAQDPAIDAPSICRSTARGSGTGSGSGS